MRYFANPSTDAVRAAMSDGLLGVITTPLQGNILPRGAEYACDNGRFGKGWPGHEKWWAWLTKTVEVYGTELCAFATAPDVVGDARATWVESEPWLPKIRALGIPAAFVAQNGCASLIPWGEFDVLFLGGDDEFKLGPEARAVCQLAHINGVPVHMGRVNSRRRIRLAEAMGCASVDGTHIAFEPGPALKRVSGWVTELRRSPTLFDLR